MVSKKLKIVNLTFNIWTDQEFSQESPRPLFHMKITCCFRLHGSKLTRLCLNKMISISVSTLATIKSHCASLTVLEIHVDKITSETDTLEQALEAGEAAQMTRLKSLKVGGSVNSGDILTFLVSGCPNLQILCFTPFAYQGEINDDFIVNLFRRYPCPKLEVFCFEKCILTEQTFFHLLETMSKVRFIGNMGEWTMDRRARLGIRAFIKGNNINVDIESLYCNYDFDVYF